MAAKKPRKVRVKTSRVRRTVEIHQFEMTCEQCGKTFWAQRKTRRWCSPACGNLNYWHRTHGKSEDDR